MSATPLLADDPPALADTPLRPAARGLLWPIVALATGSFAIGTTEFVAMGLLSEIADGLGTSIPTAGRVISAYALGVVVGGPAFAALGSRLPRRRFLIALMAVFAVGNLLSALAGSHGWLVLARFAAGLPHGAYFGAATLVAAGLAGPQRRAWAASRVLLGLTVANVVGVPAATLLGQALGWRSAFAAVAALAVLTMAAVARFVPETGGASSTRFRDELGALRRAQVWLTLGVAAIGFGGMFAVYSYVAPTLAATAGMPATAIPIVLAVWGLGMIAGSLAGGWLADRGAVRAMLAALLVSAASLVLFAVVAAHPVAATAAAFLLGTSVALGPAVQVRLMDVAPDAQMLTATLLNSAFNAANALGPWLGGMALAAGWGWTAPSWVGVGLALGGVALLGASWWLERAGDRRHHAAAVALDRSHVRATPADRMSA